jgi:hypothetical protein
MLMRSLRGFLLLLSGTMIVAFVALTGKYLASPIFFDHVEPNIAAVSWYFVHGHPLYQGPDAGEAYLMPYGPLLYALNGLAQLTLGPSIFSSKLLGVLTINLALAAVYLLFRRCAERATAVVATGFMAAYWIGISYVPLASRADPIILLLVIVALGAALTPSWRNALVLGVTCGLALNLKIHTPLYFLPVFALAACRGQGWGRLFAAGLLALALFFLPFLVAPNLSLEEFFAMLHMMSHQGLLLDLFFKNLVWLGIAVVPAGAALGMAYASDPLAARALLRRYGLFAAALAVVGPLLMAIASKNGAGAPHLMPYALIIVFAGLLGWHESPAAVSRPGRSPAAVAVTLACLAGCFVFGFYKIARAFKDLGPKPAAQARAVEADVLDILHRRGPGHVLLMGVGDADTFPRTYFRVLLIFNGMPIGIAVEPVLDWKMAGVHEPGLARLREVLARSEPGEDIIWLIPKGTVPFTHVFSADFRADFAKEYTLAESTPYFDLYQPRPATP